MLTQIPLSLEAELLVQGDGCLVVRPHLQSDLVGACLSRPFDGCLEQRAPDPPAAMRPGHLHAEMGDAPALNACGSHDLAVDLGNEPRSVLIPDRLDPSGAE